MDIMIKYIYLVGCIVALFIGIYELIKDLKNNDEPKEYAMIIPMILCSWVTVFFYFYGKLRHN